MKKILTIVQLLFANVCLAQFTDNFSDGNFITAPAWAGSSAKFAIYSGQLRLQAPGVTDIAYLSTESQAIEDASWEFLVKLDFNPSSGNYARVYLVSDQADLTGPLNGYFVLIGDTPDEVSLYRQSGTTRTKIIDGLDGRVNAAVVNVKIKVTRNAAGSWELYSDVGLLGAYTSEGSVSDVTHEASTHAGVYCVYTATRSSHFYFDDFTVSGTPVQDVTPPTLATVTVINSMQLLVSFSEELASASVVAANFLTNHAVGAPSTAVLQPDLQSVLLTFSNAFANGVLHTLSVAAVQDVALNEMVPGEATFRYFVAVPTAFQDIVINELLPDPSPQVGLPAAEFIEIVNRSDKAFDLAGWKLQDVISTATFPSFFLLPGEYAIVTNSNGVAEFESFGNVVGLAGFPTLNNSSDAFTLRDGSGVKVDSVSYALSWFNDDDKAQGGFSLERLNPAGDSNESTNWLASEDVNGGTPGRQNSVFGKNPDSKAPVLKSIQAGVNFVSLTFNESMAALAVQNSNNYLLNDLLLPAAAGLTSDTTVLLTFEDEFVNGKTNKLRFTNLTDLAGNALEVEEITFRYFIALAPSEGDILINEIMADPAPVVQLPEAEFIELINITDHPFDVGDWQLLDATDTTQLPSHILMPGEFLVLCASSNASKFQPDILVLAVPNFPSLSNSGERLALVTNSGLLLDSVYYDDSWYQSEMKEEGGWSLERLLYDFGSSEPTNWRAAEAAEGGTPGKQNSLFGKNPDVVKPGLLSAEAKDDRTILLTFTEPLAAEEAEEESNFSINGSVGFPATAWLQESMTAVALLLSEPLVNGKTYSVTVTNLTDVAGNVIEPIEESFLYFVAQPLQRKDILISEILADPSPVVQLPESEFIEIFNRSPNPVDLHNWTLTVGEDDASFPQKIIMPGEYCILTSTSQATKFGGANALALPGFPSLANSGESLVLKDTVGNMVDSVNFTLSWYRESEKADGGWSLEIIDPTNACGEEDNWAPSEHESGGTPGSQNSIFASKPDIAGPRLLAIAVNSTQLRLTFNEKLDEDLSQFSFALVPEATVESIAFLDIALRQLTITFESPLQPRTLYQLIVQSAFDCSGNAIDERHRQISFALPEAPEESDLIINEVLFNPHPNGIDFVEVYNRSLKYLDLRHWSVANLEEGLPTNEFAINESVLLAPKSYLVLTSDVTLLQSNFPLLPPDRTLKIALPSMPDQSGSIAMIAPSGMVVDSFQYSDDFHTPLLKDKEGVSLERIDFHIATHVPSNWTSATRFAGFGTPGVVNSAARPDQREEVGTIAVSPEIISPFSSQSFAQIHYAFDQHGMMANVKIIDGNGRMVNEIANNEVLGVSGFFRWDGVQQDGTPARSGYYLVWFEVFDLKGNVNTYRKRVVIANR